MTIGDVVLLLVAGFGAGVVNGMAGGGSLVSYPALLAVGHGSLVANVTNTVGILPGYLGGAAGFREQLSDQRDRVRQLAPVALVGGLFGAALLLTTPDEVFDDLVPFLIIGACLMFAVQPWVNRFVVEGRVARGADRLSAHITRPTYVAAFFAATYGGYFGAGLGVILLAVLGTALADPKDQLIARRLVARDQSGGGCRVLYRCRRGLEVCGLARGVEPGRRLRRCSDLVAAAGTASPRDRAAVRGDRVNSPSHLLTRLVPGE